MKAPVQHGPSGRPSQASTGPPSVLRLIAACLRAASCAQENPLAAEAAIGGAAGGPLAPPPDWPALIARANRSLVTAALLPGLRRLGIAGPASPEAYAYLADLHRLNTHRNAGLRTLLDEVVTALNRNGVRPVLLKGARWLADPERLAGARIMADLDLLVDPADLAASGRALRGLGFAVVDGDTADTHAVTFGRPRAPATIDLHFSLRGANGVLATHEVIAASRPASGISDASTPSGTHDVLIGLLGSQIDGPNARLGFISLRPLQDVAAVAAAERSAIDWHEIRGRLAQTGLGHRADAWAAVAAALLGIEAPAEMRRTVRARTHLGVCLAQERWPALEPMTRLWSSIVHPFEPVRLERLYGRKPLRIPRHAWAVIRRHRLGLIAKLGAQREMP